MSDAKPADSRFSPACPLPHDETERILLAHGGGGRLSHNLVERLFLPTFDDPALAARHDGAVLDLPLGRVAFTTDSFVVKPPFFPGGDIGSLAVHGTVNDLAMCGAAPVALSAALILEEGFPLGDLARVVRSMSDAAKAAGVRIVTGDTKVVERGRGDGIFVNTTGIGSVRPDAWIAPSRAEPGDAVILSGEIAVHGVAILSVREGLSFDTTLVSDSAPLWTLVRGLFERLGRDVHVLRDPTRGGVAATLVEIAEAGRVGIALQEAAIPVDEAVRGACEILGLDPLYVANEGKCLAIVSGERAEEAVDAMRADPQGLGARVVGRVVASHPGEVRIRSPLGGWRPVDMPTGEQLPRIC